MQSCPFCWSTFVVVPYDFSLSWYKVLLSFIHFGNVTFLDTLFVILKGVAFYFLYGFKYDIIPIFGFLKLFTRIRFFFKTICHTQMWIAFLLFFLKTLKKLEKLDVIDGQDVDDVMRLIDMTRCKSYLWLQKLAMDCGGFCMLRLHTRALMFHCKLRVEGSSGY